MQKFRFPLFLLFVLLGIVWLAVSRPFEAQTTLGRLFLLTEEEAAQLRLPAEPDRFLKSGPPQKTLSSGPRIVFKRPDLVDDSTALPTVVVTTPLNLLIVFEPNREDVDMASLEVYAKKGWFTKSLTSRLKPYVVGTTLAAEGLDIPVGTFRIEIEIADRNGTQTTQAYYLAVREADGA